MPTKVIQVRGMTDRQRLLSSRIWYLHLDPATDQELFARQRVLVQDASGTSVLAGSLEFRAEAGLVVVCGSDILGRVSKCNEGRWLNQVLGDGAIPLELEIDDRKELRAALRAPRIWPIARYFEAPQLAESKEATFSAFVDELIPLESIPSPYEEIARRSWGLIYQVLSEYDDWEREHVGTLPQEMEKEVNFDTVPGWREAAQELLYEPLLSIGPLLLDAFYKAVLYEQDDPSVVSLPSYGDLLDRPGGYSLIARVRYPTDAPDSVLFYEVLGVLEDLLHLSRGPCGRYWIADFIIPLEETIDGLGAKYVRR